MNELLSLVLFSALLFGCDSERGSGQYSATKTEAANNKEKQPQEDLGGRTEGRGKNPIDKDDANVTSDNGSSTVVESPVPAEPKEPIEIPPKTAEEPVTEDEPGLDLFHDHRRQMEEPQMAFHPVLHRRPGTRFAKGATPGHHGLSSLCFSGQGRVPRQSRRFPSGRV
jgi:hypothetical protein